MILGDGKLLLLLLLCPFDCLPFNRNLGVLLSTLAVCNGVWTQPAECNFDIRISDCLESGVDGLDKFCRSNLWTLVSISHPLLLKSQPIFVTVSSREYFSRIFFRTFSKKVSSFHQHEPVINNSNDYFYLFECFNRRESHSDPFLWSNNSDCWICLLDFVS